MDNCHEAESDLISLFKTKYKFRKDYGAEYFEGCYKKMISDIATHTNEDIAKKTKNFDDVWEIINH